MTVSRGKIRVSWKVRPIPVANTLSGAALVIVRVAEPDLALVGPAHSR